MQKRYSIGFFVAVFAVFAILTAAYQFSYERARELAAVEEKELEEKALATEGQALKEDCFYLMEVHGYVVVYLSDRETVYEYTDIPVADLPATLQNEIKNGKYMEDIETLYGFLENYSS